jgi:hypothetical protein
MLRALGHEQIDRFHLNEGHSALLVMELLAERLRASGRSTVSDEDVETVRRLCVFTTHTPVPAAHDQFPMDLAGRALGSGPMDALKHLCCYEGALNLTYLALNFSHDINGVAMRHGEVARRMFGGYVVDAITNGVHVERWTSEPFRTLFDRHISGWRRDNFSVRYAVSIPRQDIWDAHVSSKLRLLEYVNRTQSPPLDPSVLTIGFARRASAYKRADLLDQIESIVLPGDRDQPFPPRTERRSGYASDQRFRGPSKGTHDREERPFQQLKSPPTGECDVLRVPQRECLRHQLANDDGDEHQGDRHDGNRQHGCQSIAKTEPLLEKWAHKFLSPRTANRAREQAHERDPTWIAESVRSGVSRRRKKCQTRTSQATACARMSAFDAETKAISSAASAALSAMQAKTTSTADMGRRFHTATCERC